MSAWVSLGETARSWHLSLSLLIRTVATVPPQRVTVDVGNCRDCKLTGRRQVCSMYHGQVNPMALPFTNDVMFIQCIYFRPSVARTKILAEAQREIVAIDSEHAMAFCGTE